MGASGWVYVTVEKITGETEKAFFVMIDGESHVLPRSQIADVNNYEVGDEDIEIAITEWIANQKGLS